MESVVDVTEEDVALQSIMMQALTAEETSSRSSRGSHQNKKGDASQGAAHRGSDEFQVHGEMMILSSQDSQGDEEDPRGGSAEHAFDMLAMAGRKLYQRKEYANAIKYLKSASSRPTRDRLKELAVHRYLGKSHLAMGEYQSAGHEHELELDIAKALRDTFRAGVAYRNVGIVFLHINKVQNAIGCFQNQYEIGKLTGKKELCRMATEYLGLAYLSLHQQELSRGSKAEAQAHAAAAERNLTAAVKYSKATKSRKDECRNLGKLAHLYDLVGNPKKAVQVGKQRLAVAEKLRDRSAQSRTLCNMGNSYRKRNKLQKALRCYQRDLELCDSSQDLEGRSTTTYNLATCFQVMGDIANTLYYLREHLQAAITLKDRHTEVHAVLLIADIHASISQYSDALDFYHRAEKLGEDHAFPDAVARASEGIEKVTSMIDKNRKISSKQAAAQLKKASIPQAPVDKKTIRGRKGLLRFARNKSTALSAGPLTAMPSSSTTTSARSSSSSYDLDTAASVNDDGVQQRAQGARSRVKKRLSQMFLGTENESALYLPQDEDEMASVSLDDDLLDDAQIDINKLTLMLHGIEQEGITARTPKSTETGGADDDDDDDDDDDSRSDRVACRDERVGVHHTRHQGRRKEKGTTIDPFARSADESRWDGSNALDGMEDGSASKADEYLDIDVDVDASDDGDGNMGNIVLGEVDPQHEQKQSELLEALAHLEKSFASTISNSSASPRNGHSDSNGADGNDDGDGDGEEDDASGVSKTSVQLRRPRPASGARSRTSRDHQALSVNLNDFGLGDELSL